MEILEKISEELNLPLKKITAAVGLMDEGNTIPFISRYRKEVTGGLDDTELRTLSDRLEYLRSLEKRREEVRAAIEAQGKMTEELSAQLDRAEKLTEIEDVYRPFKQRKKTRADVAKEKGLEPLADLILEQRRKYEPLSILHTADSLVNEEKGVLSAEEALNGACDIIAEKISDDAEMRKYIRELSFRHGKITASKVKDAEDEKGTYATYYEFEGKITDMPGYRVLALNRGEKEGVLNVSVSVPSDLILNGMLYNTVTDYSSPAFKYISSAVVDSYERLIGPSIEREIRNELFDDAGEKAIKVFSDNLKNLLLTPPLKGKTVLGLDPGYRTGCKLAVVDRTGKVLDTAVIYPTKPKEDIIGSERIVLGLIKKYAVDFVAIGNGTASKESEKFISDLLKRADREVHYAMVSEAGASVYSASELAAAEFPDFDVTQRSAVSIARRLQDALAELVKIDPKSIGVGQYQHDMKQNRLSESLTAVVEDCVNSVGVDLNTASHSLLSYVAGINTASAKNIVTYREENGEFRNRKELLSVPKIGPKAFQQCAGFLRVPGSTEALDLTAVHPESYSTAKSLLDRFGYSEEDIRKGGISGIKNKAEEYGIKKLSEELGTGDLTLADILSELEKPGRDIRDSMPSPEFRDDVMDMNDLKPGMTFTGTVRNVVDFGAFVDIGVHQDGLV
ncbi:MAG: RNA-binding transcriptional accessory protein, partial [Firmicutes bacterium]|nr:RNA-binding transcriptional accessory protein [Candidatus Colimorpha enterica]